MFRRAVSNLLSNALRHAPEAGDVTIRIAATAQATTVTVENTGADIDAKTLPRLFDRFYRADASRATRIPTDQASGLAITRAIAEAHGGSVTASSGQGQHLLHLCFPITLQSLPADNKRIRLSGWHDVLSSIVGTHTL